MNFKLSIITLALLPALATAATANSGSNKAIKYQSDSLIVLFKQGASKFEKQKIRRSIGASMTDRNRDGKDDKFKTLHHGQLAHLKLRNMTVDQAIKKLSANPNVEYAEPNFIYTTSTTPDDPRYSELWAHNNTTTPGADISSQDAWEITTGSSDVIIGVIDTGVDYNHEDLAGNSWVNPNEIAGDGIDNDNNGYIDDVHGINAITGSGDPMDDADHGSHVAGTIGAKGNNGIGVTGVNWDVSIIGCKFLSSAGTGTTADAIECIDYMVALKNSGINIVALNNSWGGGGFSQALEDSISAAGDANILFLAAAGNGTSDNDVSPHYPSNYTLDNVLSIASTNSIDNLSLNSSWGSNWGATSVDMAAPGTAILSTIPGGYATFSGTSMATPQVTGAAALAYSINPSLSALQLKELLMTSGDELADLAGKMVEGRRLNLHQLLIDTDPQPGFKLSSSPQNQQKIVGETAVYNFSVGSIADWAGIVSLSMTGDLAGASLSASSVNAGGSFTLTVPTTDDTNWGDYEFTVTASGDTDDDAATPDVIKTKTVSLKLIPQGLEDHTYDNTTAVDIPDNDSGGVNSIIHVQDPLTVFGTSAHINITHTWSGDIIATLTSPSGTVHTLRNRSGGSVDDIDQTYSTDAFNGEVATGDWTLNVSDNAGADTGTLNSWSITLTATGEVLPAPPAAAFTFDNTNALSVAFTDSSTDANDDIMSWSWNFGDGMTSTEQNPVHVYASAGTYAAMLTVTDAEDNSSDVTHSVTVSDVAIELDVRRSYRSRTGTLRVYLQWNSTGEQVDIYRNGVKIKTTADTGRFTDRERKSTEDTYIYKVCTAGDICSNEVTVNF
ncbi:MAG: S8 family serine peptidase [Gammaproteobacteria bacterium]|nr:S8 family serine peptidase [Gammaproteobacteria bacterium]